MVKELRTDTRGGFLFSAVIDISMVFCAIRTISQQARQKKGVFLSSAGLLRDVSNCNKPHATQLLVGGKKKKEEKKKGGTKMQKHCLRVTKSWNSVSSAF